MSRLLWSHLRGVSYLLGALLLLTLFIAACGDDDTPEPTPAAATPAPTAMPTPTPAPTMAPEPQPVVDKVVVAITPPSPQNTLFHKVWVEGSGPLRGMYETLIGFNRFTREYEATRLATDWSVSPDGTKWTYILRQGIPFHNGTEFTAQDVVFTWEQYANSMLSGSALMMEVIDGEDSFSIPNPHEITWNLNRPEATIGIWTSDMFQWLNYSKDHWDAVGEEGYAADPIGTGPFRFVSFGENSHIAFERVEDHWRQTPEMNEIEFRYMKEDATRVAPADSGFDKLHEELGNRLGHVLEPPGHQGGVGVATDVPGGEPGQCQHAGHGEPHGEHRIGDREWPEGRFPWAGQRLRRRADVGCESLARCGHA